MKIFLYMYYLCTLCSAYEIIIPLVYTVPSESELFHSLARRLLSNGHHVTFITPFDPKDDHVNLTVIVLDERAKPASMDPWQIRKDPSSLEPILEEVAVIASELFCQDERVRALWNERHKYDMVMTDTYYNEIGQIFLHKFNGTSTEVCTAGLEYQCLRRLGNKVSPSFLPYFWNGILTEDMNFFERIENVYYQYLIQGSFEEPVAQHIANKYYPEVGDIRYHSRVDLTLINSHFVLDYPVPLLPNQVEIGCLDCRLPQPLPKDIRTFIEDSGDAGIIYFSLGSITKISQLPPDKVEAIVEAFRRIPQRVIMKAEYPLENLSENVFTSKWLPQSDILGHPKTKAFISHCGIHSSQEAKYFGIPVLAMPIFVDQPRIARSMENAGQAIVIQWEKLTTDIIIEALNKLVNDSNYIENMKMVSRAIQDQKESSAERAVWWIEHIIRQGGSQTMIFPGKKFDFMQYYLYDIFIAFIITICVAVSLLVFLCKRFVFRKNTTGSRNQKQKKT